MNPPKRTHCRRCSTPLVQRTRIRNGKEYAYGACPNCKSTPPPMETRCQGGVPAKVAAESSVAVDLIFELGDRLARGDYLNVGEARQMRERIAFMSRSVRT